MGFGESYIDRWLIVRILAQESRFLSQILLRQLSWGLDAQQDNKIAFELASDEDGRKLVVGFKDGNMYVVPA